MERVELVKRCLYAYGQAIRGDWSCIDGRKVQDNLEDLAWLLNEDSNLPTFEDWIRDAGIVEEGNGLYGWI